MEKFDIQQLVDKINYHTKLYDEGKPIISDQEFDDLYFELLEAERNTGIYLENSPTQRINYEVVNELKKVKHNHPMLSLAKTKSLDEVRSFIKGRDIVYMLKLDGLTCSLGYKDGKLVSAETRGNGEEGEDILHNALAVKSIPKRIPYKGDLTVDGEIICFRDKFQPFAEEYANSRNFAAGSIRLLDSNESAKRNLDFVAWDLINDNIYKLSHKLEYLSVQGFLTVPFIYDSKTGNELFMSDCINSLKEIAEREGSPIDGIVIKWDDCEEYAAAGLTGHHPRAALAYKFYDETYTTYLENIEFTMGRTGILTPVAIYHPVEIDGAECTRASLHNLTIMKQLLGTPYQGQALEIFKANQIIPQVASAGIPESKADIAGLEIKIPEVCPICGAKLDIECEVDTEVLRCNNPDCSGSLVNKLEHFVSKKGLDIKGLSKATLTKLVDNWDWVNEPYDLYILKNYRDKWIDKEGFGQKSVDNILQAIEDSKNPTLDAFISAIGIPQIGKTLSKEIAKQFKNYQEYREAIDNKWNFMEIDKIAEEKCSSILNFDYTEADRVATHMESIDAEPLTAAAGSQSLEGQTVVITGKLAQFRNRDELTKEIQSRGGKVTSSVSKNTSWLVNNDINSTSSKNNTAQRLGVPIITEEEFMNMFFS